MGCEPHGTDHIALAPITGGKTHLAVTHLDNAVVGNRHPVGVAADILQYLFGTAKGFFGGDHPRLVTQLGCELCKAWGCAEVRRFANEG